MNYYVHVFVVLFTVFLFYKLVSKVISYIKIEDVYIQGKTDEDIFSLYDKLITFLYSCIILVIIVAFFIMLTDMQPVLIDLKGFLIPFGGLCFCLFTAGFFIAKSPTYLKNERKRYIRGNNVMSGGFL